jgi:predicted protein tyrosine phosphatase
MKNTLFAVLFAVSFLSATRVMGQIYNDKSEVLTAPMDAAAEKHLAIAANAKVAGDDEAKLSQEERYEEMTEAVDNANERHLNAHESFTHP